MVNWEKARNTMFNTMSGVSILVAPKANICQQESHVPVLFLEEFCSILSNITNFMSVVLNYNCKVSVSNQIQRHCMA